MQSDNPSCSGREKHTEVITSDNGKSLVPTGPALSIVYRSGNPELKLLWARDGMEPPKITDNPSIEAGKTTEQNGMM